MVSNAQRALWTFLLYALVAPFLAALALVVIIALALVLGVAALLPGGAPSLGEAGLAAFVWSVLPATLTALILAAVVWRTGGISWMAAAAVAVIAFAAAAMLLPLGFNEVRPYLAFLAGLVSIAVRQILIEAGIILA
jgi:hypothetical protein